MSDLDEIFFKQDSVQPGYCTKDFAEHMNKSDILDHITWQKPSKFLPTFTTIETICFIYFQIKSFEIFLQ